MKLESFLSTTCVSIPHAIDFDAIKFEIETFSNLVNIGGSAGPPFLGISTSFLKFEFCSQIVFEAIRGDRYTGDIAIDDIRVLNQKCSQDSNNSDKIASTLNTTMDPSKQNIQPSTTNKAPNVSSKVASHISTMSSTLSRITIINPSRTAPELRRTTSAPSNNMFK